MTTLFTTYQFKPTDTTGDLSRSRSLPDALADIVNVKDFGATGDGVTDDTTAIKAAIAAAWKTAGAWSGWNVGVDWLFFNNKPLFFPAGDYIVTDTLYVQGVMGPWMFGEGSKTTTITYKGLLSNRIPNGTTPAGFPTQDLCNLFFFNGGFTGLIQGIAFVMRPVVSGVSGIHNTAADKSCCFNWNWSGGSSGVLNGTFMVFIDCGFQDATYGMLMGHNPATSGWGAQTDTASWYGCWADNCFYGVCSLDANSIHSCWIGGSIRNCDQSGAFGMFFNQCLSLVQGCDLSNNDFDFQFNGVAASLWGCTSTSTNFAIMVVSGCSVNDCIHAGTVGGISVQSSPNVGININNSKLSGKLYGSGNFYVRETDFSYSGWATDSLGSNQLGELTVSNTIGGSTVTGNAFTFAQLPPITAVADGMMVSIRDCPTTTWGATVTTGSSSNHVLLRSNGTNWTVVGK